jgi:hypothetical protein
MTSVSPHNAQLSDANLDMLCEAQRASVFASAAVAHEVGELLTDWLAARVAAAWRYSDTSPLGEFATTGAIGTRSGMGMPACSTIGEARQALAEAVDRPHVYTARDAPALAALIAYLEHHGERGPVANWDQTLGDPLSQAVTFGDSPEDMRAIVDRLSDN